MKRYINHHRRIEVNPEIMLGKPVIKGTRVPVYLIIKMAAQGITFDEILKDYPQLTRKDILAALQYAGDILDNEEIFPAIRVRT